MDRPGLDSFTSNASELLLNPRTPEGIQKQCRRIVAAVGPEREHFWLLTSGSTGTPKLVALAKSAVLVSAESVNRHLAVVPSDVWGLTLPTFHVGGLGILARSYLAGNRIFTLAKWEPKAFVHIVTEERVTLTSLVPTQLYDLVQGQFSAPHSLRAAIIGGGALPPNLYRDARRLGWPVLPSFGMTETASQIATATLGTLDTETDSPLITVLTHAAVAINAEGLLTVSGDSLLTGYATWEEDKPQFHDPKVNGIFTTEDYARLERDIDDTPAIVSLGRKGRVVKVKGELVSLEAVEQKIRPLLRGFPTIREVAVLTVPHERDGNRLTLYLESSLLSESEIAGFREALVVALLPFERPTEIRTLTAFPRSELGKVQFARL